MWFTFTYKILTILVDIYNLINIKPQIYIIVNLHHGLHMIIKLINKKCTLGTIVI